MGNAVFNQGALLGRRFFQHPVRHIGPVAGVADANAQPPVVVGAELGMDVAQPVVAGVAATALEFGLSWRQVQLVVHHQDFGRGDLVKTCQCRHRLA